VPERPWVCRHQRNSQLLVVTFTVVDGSGGLVSGIQAEQRLRREVGIVTHLGVNQQSAELLCKHLPEALRSAAS